MPMGVTLWWARTRRYFTTAQNLIFKARSGGECDTDGCHTRYHSEAHHLVEYADGGRTDPDNGANRCWWHHQWEHRHGRRPATSRPPPLPAELRDILRQIRRDLTGGDDP